MQSNYSPDNLSVLLKKWNKPWWIAGGWAIDLFLGTVTRPHEDLDVMILRQDQIAIHAYLNGWDMHIGFGEGHIDPEPWSGISINPPLPAIWCRPDTQSPWSFELLLSEAQNNMWTFKRDPTICLPLEEIGLMSNENIPYVRPEIVLLFKAKKNRDIDQLDFTHVLHHLASDRKQWLYEAISKVHPDHPWLPTIIRDK